jgi:hypothetical protein
VLVRYQHHFVVYGAVNDNGEFVWTIDEGTCQNKFPDGPVFDTEADPSVESEWLEGQDNEASFLNLAHQSQDAMFDLQARLGIPHNPELVHLIEEREANDA